ncbi:phospholipase-like protein [Tanacetum coccineum]
MRQAWFKANVDFIKGWAEQDDKFLQDDEARVNCIEHNNEMCGDTEVGKFVQDEEARVNGIEHHNGMCGDTKVCKFVQDEEAIVNGIEHHNGMFGDTKVGKFVQYEEVRVNGIEHHNGMCGDTDDGNFVEGINETICPKSNQMLVEEGDGVLDYEGDGIHLSQTNDVIQQAVNLSTMSSTSPQAINPAVAEFFSEFDALKKEVFLLKKRKDDEFDELTKIFSKLETSQTFVMFKNLLKTGVCTENESTYFNPKKSEDMPNFCSNHNDTSNHIGGLSTEAKPSSSSSHPRNDKDASHLDDLMKIDGENVKDSYPNSQDHLHLLIKGLESKTENPSLDVVVPPKDDDFILCTIKPNYAYDVVEVDNYDDDYMLMLKDEEKIVKSSLNDMELEQEPDKIYVNQEILEQQPNAPKGKTIVFEETVRVKVEEKPGLGRATTRVPKKRKSRFMKTEVNMTPFDLEDISGQPRIWSMNDIMTHEPFVENLSRPDDCKSDKVTVPEHMCEFITNKDLPEYQFPWGKRDIIIGRSFWLSLSCLNTVKAGWLNDHHLDLWIDLMWYLRPPEADWAILLRRSISVNEPKTHWCLADLEIHTRVVTFYDSLGWAGGSRRRWWRRMKKLLLEKLTVYLVMHGILESKGISADDYKITYKYADAPFQASLFGDCGIWVCIFIYRLCRNLPLTVDDPLETALAYRERMLEYFWSHKIPVERTSLDV